MEFALAGIYNANKTEIRNKIKVILAAMEMHGGRAEECVAKSDLAISAIIDIVIIFEKCTRSCSTSTELRKALVFLLRMRSVMPQLSKMYEIFSSDTLDFSENLDDHGKQQLDQLFQDLETDEPN